MAVTANAASCAWTAASNAPWITITAGASGSGNGTVAYTVAANASTTGRTGTMTIAGQTMTVTQAGAPCNYAISPTVASLGPNCLDQYGRGHSSAGCAWTASESASWITITSGASGIGNGTVTYSVTANPTITARSAVMTIAGQSFDVTQAGQTCTYTLTPAGASVPATATTGRSPSAHRRLRLDGDLVRPVGDDYERRERHREWDGRLLGGRQHDHQSADRDADDRRPAVHDYPGRGAVHLRGDAGDALDPGLRRAGNGDADDPGRLCLERHDQRAVDHDQRHRHGHWKRDGWITQSPQTRTASAGSGTIAMGGANRDRVAGGGDVHLCVLARERLRWSGRVDGQLLGRGKQRVCVDRDRAARRG